MIRRKIFIPIIAFFSGLMMMQAQDVAVISITAPVSGCSLTATENVVVRIFNYGPTDLSGVNIPVSYIINGGAPVNEVANFPSFLQNSTATYTFTTQADLSVAGSYTVDATTALVGDINTTNDAFTGYTVTNTAPSVGGTVTGGTNVCVSGNSGNLTLAGHTGSVLNWESSTDGGSTWISISNTTTSQSYTNLTIPTSYRAVVQNGSCASANSVASAFTIDPVTVAGTIASSATICSGSSGNLNLAGKTGNVTNWESSTDGGVTWIPIVNTTTSQPYTALVASTRYRANVQSGACAAAITNTVTITVNPTTVGGSLAPVATTVCSGINGGTLTLSGHTGTITRWEFSTNGGTTWSSVANTTTTLNYTNLVATRMYRALVRSGVCANMYSATATVTVIAGSVGGTVSSSATVCSGANAGTLTLSGEAGTILNWEFSTDGGTSYTPIANTTNTENYTNIATNTLYRAVVQNGACTAANSSVATLTVNSASVGGVLSANDTVCASSNSGAITLAGQTGTVQNWEYSNDNGTTWTNIVNVTTSNAYTNLTDTTLYRASVKNGVCTAVFSDTVEIVVDPITVAGSITGGGLTCSGLNSDTLFLTGQTGAVQSWEYSTDGGSTWVNILNDTTIQVYNNISSNTLYHALVKSGVCAVGYSSSATLTVDPQALGGTTYGATTVCQGANTGVITLLGHSANVFDWISSTDGGLTWSSLGNTTSSYSYTNLAQSTIFSAIASSAAGVCPNDTSTTTTISIDIPSVGGAVSIGDTVCAGNNAGTLNLAGHTGNILNWEYSVDNGTSWILLSNTTTSQNYSNLNQSTYYRANIKNGVCASDLADSVFIKVDSSSVAGMISSPAHLCISNANGTLTLSGYTGSIVDWQSSSDNGATWTGLTNTNSTNLYAALTDTTYYRAIVSSGVCGNDTSASVMIGIDALSSVGAISSSDTVCASGNGATLTLGAITGTIQGWEYSSDNGNSWIPLANTTANQVYSNLTSTRMYRAYVQNGVCPVAVADTAIITVDAVVEAGSISSPAQLCISNANGTLNLSGYTGSIVDWQSSADNGTTWSGLTNTTNTNVYSALTDTTYYRAIVSSGVCGNDTTSNVIISVDQLSVGGSAGINDTVCASLNGDTLALIAYTGNVVGWEFSTNNGNSWMALTNTNDSLVYSSLSTSTVYHAIVKSGVCPPVYSSDVTIKVDAVTNPGFITGGSTACQSNNMGVLNLNNSLGLVLDWIYSNDNGATWLSTATDSLINYTYNDLGDTTWFKAIVKNGVCATDTSNAQTVYIYPNPVVSLSLDTVCLRDTTHIIASVSIPSGLIQQYNLIYGDGTTLSNAIQNHVYAVADTFNVSLTAYSTFGCTDTAFATAIVKRIPSAVILHSSPLSFCPGDSTLLNFSLDSNAVYTWSTLATDTFTVVDSTLTVLLTVTDTLNGCSAKDSVQVVQFILDSISAGIDTSVALGSSIQLQGYGTGTVNWTPASLLDFPLVLNPIATLTTDTMFVIQITDGNSCVQRDTVEVTVNLNYVFDVKDVITPNNDGMNDVWYIKNIESYKDNEVTVFNRDGNIVYNKKEYTNDWEGTFNGQQLPDGAYFYIIKFDENEKVLKGTINILTNK
jgi:gliding motility-associated-like protein